MRRSNSRAATPRRSVTEPPVTRHILVATKGSDDVAPEIRVARALADRHGSKVDVVSVVTPVVPSPMISDLGLVGSINPIAPAPPDLRGQRHRIADELARAGRPGWDVTVVGGWPAEKIPEIARQIGATLIVMGIGRHAPIDRLLGSETTLQVIQETDIPVLAVSSDLAGVPKQALAALDFSEQSEIAARIAAELVAEDGTLFLTHIRVDLSTTGDSRRNVDLYAAGAERRFDELQRRLSRDRVAPRFVERVLRTGDPVPAMLHFTAETDVDLIAVGAQTHSRIHRLLLGSVAAKLLRGAPCSVLVVPARAESARRSAPRRPATRKRRRAASQDAGA
jgi:nucleotide-binding universal stress UspA family protein